jgi:hypothetical protein
MLLPLLPYEISRRNSTQPFGELTWLGATRTWCPDFQILPR